VIDPRFTNILLRRNADIESCSFSMSFAISRRELASCLALCVCEKKRESECV